MVWQKVSGTHKLYDFDWFWTYETALSVSHIVHELDWCFVENEGDSFISATSSQQSSTNAQIQLKDEAKPAEAAKLSTEVLAEVFIYVTSAIFSVIIVPCDILLSLWTAIDGSSNWWGTPHLLRTRLGDRSFAVAGPQIWNSLPTDLRLVDNYARFRRLLKGHMFGWGCGAWWLFFLVPYTNILMTHSLNLSSYQIAGARGWILLLKPLYSLMVSHYCSMRAVYICFVILSSEIHKTTVITTENKNINNLMSLITFWEHNAIQHNDTVKYFSIRYI